jgi:hypothetical protein
MKCPAMVRNADRLSEIGGSIFARLNLGRALIAAARAHLRLRCYEYLALAY